MVVQKNSNNVAAYIGGGPFNTALALARLEQDVLFINPVSNDNYGSQIIEYMQTNNIQYHCGYRSKLASPLALSYIDKAGSAKYQFYLANTALGDLKKEKIISNLPDKIEIIHTGTLVIAQTATSNIIKNILLIAKQKGALISLDPNIRAEGFAYKEYRANITKIMHIADIIKLSDEDAGFLYPNLNPFDALERIHIDYPQAILIVITRGAKSVLYKYTGNINEITVPSITINDTIGAGDCFIAGFLFALKKNYDAKIKSHNLYQHIKSLTKLEIDKCVKTAIKATSLNCQKQGCNPTYLHELETL